MSEKDSIQKRIETNKRRLQKLKETKARQGISTPPEIELEIEDIQTEVNNLEADLVKLEGIEEEIPFQNTKFSRQAKQSNQIKSIIIIVFIIFGLIAGSIYFWYLYETIEPIYVTIKLIEENKVLFLTQNTSVNGSDEKKVQSLLQGVWVRVTSPIGTEVILDNTIGIKVLDYRPANKGEIQCLAKNLDCTDCGGNPIPLENLNVEVPTQIGNITWTQPTRQDAPKAYDLSFPHMFEVKLHFVEDGFYKLAVVAKYTFRGQEAETTQELGDYIFTKSSCEKN